MGDDNGVVYISRCMREMIMMIGVMRSVYTPDMINWFEAIETRNESCALYMTEV